ncbi:MAG TPA: peptidylprolyl isomerase [Acidimicrobiales bacterium]|nr:peptidylprolyl isomerase [Acidimicrobiales bacterium]
MPSEKRARQRAAREARLAAQARTKKRRQLIRNIIIVGVVGLLIVGIAFAVSSNNKNKTTSGTGSTTTTLAGSAANAKSQAAADAVAAKAGCPSATATRVNTQKYARPANVLKAGHLYSATVVTTAGTFAVALNTGTAPVTVNNFVFLAERGYYHCVIFHRVIPGFMDQTGDPTGTGSGGPGYTIADENPPKAATATQQYPLGSLAMANTGQPHSGGSQFFIVAGPQGEGLSNSYALFGRVISGMDVVSRINAEGSAAGVPPNVTQRIISITIHEAAGA